MELVIRLAGDVVDRQELLNGAQSATLEGASEDGEWVATGLLTWNIGLKADTGEGDITLARTDGSEIFASLLHGAVVEGGVAEDAGHVFDLVYEIDGGSADFESASGRIEAEGTLAEASFTGVWTLSLAI